jgi:hypothetical protein
MYKHIASFMFLLLAVIISGVISPANAFATLPGTIGGLKVLVTFPPGSQACTPANTIRILLQSNAPDVRTYLKSNRVQLILQELDRLQRLSVANYQVSVVGPNATVDKISQNAVKWNSAIARFGCHKLSSQSSTASSGTNGDEFIDGYTSPGRAVFENMDAANYPSGGDIDNGQSVYLTSPSLIDPDNWSSAFLNNVFTNQNYLLQNGFWFAGTTGHLIYANYEHNEYEAQLINSIPYVAGQEYWFVISHSWAWQLCQYNTSDINTYECVIDETTPGDNLQADFNTGIWFENFNTNSNWADSFPPFSLKMQDAEIFINGFPNKWGSQHVHTSHHCGTPPLYPTSTAMSATLVNGGIAYFNAQFLPLQC